MNPIVAGDGREEPITPAGGTTGAGDAVDERVGRAIDVGVACILAPARSHTETGLLVGGKPDGDVGRLDRGVTGNGEAAPLLQADGGGAPTTGDETPKLEVERDAGGWGRRRGRGAVTEPVGADLDSNWFRVGAGLNDRPEGDASSW